MARFSPFDESSKRRPASPPTTLDHEDPEPEPKPEPSGNTNWSMYLTSQPQAGSSFAHALNQAYEAQEARSDQ